MTIDMGASKAPIPPAADVPVVRAFFLFFLGSGFAGLVYEIVWLRLAMASFGVTTPFVSIVLSVVMAGLALGSWLAGRLARRLSGNARRALACYAAAEAGIGVLALGVPWALAAGRASLAGAERTLVWDSTSYYVASGAWVAITLLPASVAMGATFPLAMAAIRAERPDAPPTSFSFLYLANVLGATIGTLASAFVLIEVLGFRTTLVVAVFANFLVAAGAFGLSRRASSENSGQAMPSTHGGRAAGARVTVLGGLLLTGLVSMAMEVVWVRQFTPYLGNVVYAFAGILATYLAATFVGTRVYRLAVARGVTVPVASVWIVAGLAGLLPLLAADPRVPLADPFRLVLGVAPVCAVIGWLTPMLIDRWSGGDPDRGGAAYAVNVLGAIVGPLVAGFALLPRTSESASIVVLAAPLFVVGLLGLGRSELMGAARASRRELVLVPVAAALAIAFVTGTRSFETRFAPAVVRRDHTATVVATGHGLRKDLVINGTSTTQMTPITKWMAHLPLVFLERPPTDALVICFGMGTTFRSLLSWDLRATAVELVPSVPDVFWYFHADALEVVRSPKGRIVIDDGRRFLERTRDRYDVVTIDPPNPPEAAGSSLLYSREFYRIARARLRDGAILQQWIPATDVATVASVARALGASFPHVRAFPAVNRTPEIQVLGIHFLASEHSIPRHPVSVLAARLPPRAARDLLEWADAPTVEDVFLRLVSYEVPLAAFIELAPRAPALEDDRPYNEYFLLRRWGLY